MDARGLYRSQVTEEFLQEARIWDLEGDLTENRRGPHDPDKTVTIELTPAQLGRLADILRHARGENWFDPDHGFGSRPVDWRSYHARVDAERQLAADRAVRYAQKLEGG